MKTASWSLANRLAWRLAAVLVAAIGLAAIAVGWRAIVTAGALDDTALQVQVRAVAAHLAIAPDGSPRVDLPPALRAAFHTGEGGNVFLITTPQGSVRLSSDPTAAALIAPYVPETDGLFRVPATPAQTEGMVGFVAGTGQWRVAVAQSREQSEVLVRSLLGEFFSTGLVLLTVIGGTAALIGIWTVADGLRPLRSASAAASRVDPAQPGVRLPDADLPGEVAPLVAAVNQALARLEAALGAQRRFVGEAAHALRTPLAVLTARLDALAEGPQADLLRRDADRMTRLIEQMLHMARLDGQPLDVSKPVILRAVAIEAISLLAPLAVRRDLELALRETGSPGPLAGNHAALVIALTNLIENAVAHAPPGSLVEIELAAPARLTVLDRGPGVPAAEREAIFERFHRGQSGRGQSGRGQSGRGQLVDNQTSHSQTGQPSGAGLGLAIVAGVAAAHGGATWVQPREGGGAAFVLDLATSADHAVRASPA